MREHVLPFLKSPSWVSQTCGILTQENTEPAHDIGNLELKYTEKIFQVACACVCSVVSPETS